ncbi:RNA polymerase sigma-70 factor [Chitinophaga horti]|uniref:RNA polymerase sigma-70 factor n=1 Tax=Chitinophaga horti TaxID=2920382 RepID=A0ABY6JBY4_9BACT|nr:RNA polymerase sigma-70 factor [Chitinophaga horti]UYQ95801.1 RNA polymerase sigma-70 factor [Chitinophaga horti]
MEEMSDIALLHLLERDDEHAFTSLFHRYRNKIYSIGLELTDSAFLAEEIVQDVFLNIWLKRKQLGEVAHFRAYLFTTARNVVINALKKKATEERIARELALPVDYDTTNYEALLSKEYETVMREAITRLPARQQQVYRLVREDGLKREEVAALLNISPETVKSSLADAMRSIRAYCKANLDLLGFLLISILLD